MKVLNGMWGVLVGVVATLSGCTTSSKNSEEAAGAGETAPTGGHASSGGHDEGGNAGGASEGEGGSALPAARDCAPVSRTTKCATGGDAAILRAVVRFDPTRVVVGDAKPALSVFLRHSWVLSPEEQLIGGRLHAYKRLSLTESVLASGVREFELDLCDNEIAMWSEENGPFNLVVMLDVDGSNNLQTATEQYAFQTADVGELTKMVSDFSISCHSESTCLDVVLDCTGGTDCTTITPIDQWVCVTPACDSDDAFCATP